MNKDQVKGRARQVEGNVQEAVGKAVGNPKHNVKGKLKRAAGKIQAAYGDLKDRDERSDLRSGV